MNKGTMLVLALLLTGCGNDQEIAACHDKVQGMAKYTAEIVSTDTTRKGLDLDMVTGRAKLQTGRGAWRNYRYSCSYQGSTLTAFDMQEGWAP
ncbi:hypothetical protein [Bowmanella denitrificans]|uniref:hypothetical protein n=1 Tax=Bowmanella denitrificans TaxID=366582 RepID=UPI000C9AF321|nr:hypothetical protein [Bowmanella denitrificans]